MGAPDKIKSLVESFHRNIDDYKVGKKNETELRREYLDPFFTALGWDVENKAGYADAYKDVIHEYSLKTKDVREAPDYCFRIGGTRKFFVEAKKPSVNVKDDIHPAFQLRSYAWSAKLSLSILTDFEEFAVYDCRIPPNKKDKASNARIMLLTYDQYIDKWDELENIFSIDAIRKGSFDKYIESNKKKKGTAEVDEVFLEQMEAWRKSLAKNIAIRNPKLSIRELNYSVQKTIDRIIFLRICEDRGIEDYGQLMSLQNGVNVYDRLKQIFYRADEKYNSGLFHFEKERDRIEPPDNLTLDLSIDDKTIKEIVKELYYPDSPYEFSVLPADILGQVYEQFLGKVIRLTPAHHAEVDDKPEVKKTGGVYYTPTYIVDYIVNNTVGRLLTSSPLRKGRNEEGFQNPKQVTTLKVLDPACGSGSFLLGAYQYLLDWHLKYYLQNPAQPSPLPKGRTKEGFAIYQDDKGQWRLTTSEKKRILLNNIYGVDIDPQAVEVTKLSLMLKVLEGESTQTLNNELQFFRERALPDLSNNIKCGNSLIGPDFYNQIEMNFLDEEEKLRINVFDWHKEFPQVFNTQPALSFKRRGNEGEVENVVGFDVVIGNPPYGMRLIYSEAEKEYLKIHFESSKGSFENYFLFYEASLRLLKMKGIHGFIVPITWLTIPSAESLRKYILDRYSVNRIVWLPELVFKNAQVNTLVSVISRDKSDDTEVYIFNTTDINSNNHIKKIFKQSDFISNEYKIDIFINLDENEIFGKINKDSVLLGDISKPCSGYNPYEVGKGIAPNGKAHTIDTVKTKPYHSNIKLDDSWKSEIVGRDLRRYKLNIPGERWIKYGDWLAAARDPENFTGKRILVQEITGGKDKRIIAVFYDGELYHSRDVIPIKCTNEQYHPFYLLGIINSNLISWLHRKRNPKSQKGLFPKVLVSDLRNLQIPIINTSNTELVNKLIRTVESMISLNTKLDLTKTPTERTAIERQIQATDTQIDQLVYQLYGLTEEEIKIVEGN